MQKANRMILPSDPRILYQGRFDLSDPDTPRFDWPGTAIHVRIKGTGCRFILEEELDANAYTIIIDGVPGKSFVATPSNAIVAADGPSDQSHSIALFKRSESENHAARFKGIDLDKGAELLAPPILSDRRIEFIGDSHTAALAVEAIDWSNITILSHNAGRSYAAITARHFGADFHLCASSGKGLVHNHSDPEKQSRFPLPALYERSLVSSETSRWDFSRWVPRIVVINAGTNDFAERFEMLQDPAKTIADESVFQEAYHRFIGLIRQRYPGVFIVMMGPFDPCGGKERAAEVVKRVFDEECSSGNKNIQFHQYPSFTDGDYVCCHPGIVYHERIAESLIRCIEEKKCWDC